MPLTLKTSVGDNLTGVDTFADDDEVDDVLLRFLLSPTMFQLRNSRLI